VRSRKLFAELNFSCPMGTVTLDTTLCQIDPNHHIFHIVVLYVVWLSTPRPWQIAIPSGEGDNHSICIYQAAGYGSVKAEKL
jgi:hypothetical protein